MHESSLLYGISYITSGGSPPISIIVTNISSNADGLFLLSERYNSVINFYLKHNDFVHYRNRTFINYLTTYFSF